uniref:Uncharacterized protein n=1 Tax=Arundo donax TaxID=35708 RepID=A0A0A9H9I6_ARUDO
MNNLSTFTTGTPITKP